MIAETIKFLQSNNWYGISESIEIAKGRDEKIYTFKEGVEKIYRQWRLKK
jgi:hypothetical protein